MFFPARIISFRPVYALPHGRRMRRRNERQVFSERLACVESYGRSYFRRLFFLRTATVCLLESSCREGEKQKMAGEPIKKRIDFFLFTFYAIFASFFTLYPIPAYKSHDSRAFYKHF